MAIVTIAKEAGSGGTQIGQSAARLLNYEFVSLKKIYDEVRQMGDQWKRAMEDYENGYTTLWEKYDWSFMGFVALSQSIIFNYALKDNVVIMARGGNILLHDIPHCLNIKVVAPFEKRLENYLKSRDGENESTRLALEKADKELNYSIHQMYGTHGNAPETYDLIFNTEFFIPEAVANAIQIACIWKNACRTEDSVKALHLKGLAYKIKAAIATNPHFLVPTLEVSPQGKGLVVRGVVRSINKYNKLEEEVLRLAGDIPVTFDLHFRGSF